MLAIILTHESLHFTDPRPLSLENIPIRGIQAPVAAQPSAPMDRWQSGTFLTRAA